MAKFGRFLVPAFALGVASLVLLTTGRSEAESYSWHNVVIGGGGYVPSVVFSPMEKGLAYLRTDMGGAYRWDDSAKVWIPLEDGLGSSRYFGIESLAVDPKDANTVYLATGTYRADQAAILRSSDRGKNWDKHDVPFHMGGNEPGRAAGERLMVDPNNTDVLYFGSRWDGLQVSTDRGSNWSKAAGFPSGTGFFLNAKGEVDYAKPVSIGISFMAIDAKAGQANGRSKILYAGLADPGPHHLYRSTDGGATWAPVPGEPRADLLPVHGAVDDTGALYIVYSINSTGPYGGLSDGAVYKLDRDGRWTDITPDKAPGHPAGGYGGLALDPQHPGTVLVATAERWSVGDTLWRTTDAGAHWQDIKTLSKQDVTETPYLTWGDSGPKFGWWMSGVAIDPFDANHAMFTTGATVYATTDMGKPNLLWKPWIKGVEEMAVLSMVSPPAGPPLVSAMADVGGFVHDDLTKSPTGMFSHPTFGRTNVLDFAGMAPNVMVRSGVPSNKGKDPALAYSTDYGHTWSPLAVPALRGLNEQGQPITKRYDLDGDTAIAVSADGSTIFVMTPVPLYTRDFGKHWAAVKGLPMWSRVIADRVNPKRLYAIDLAGMTMLASADGGETFAPTGVKLYGNIVYKWPTNPGDLWPLMATPGVEGDLWIKTGSNELYHSGDGGASFKFVDTHMSIETLAFGKPSPGKDYPTLYTFGWNSPIRMIFRSTDKGKSWRRINDDAHQYGWAFKSLAGDPRVYGRVYLGTDGRGIIYGDVTE